MLQTEKRLHDVNKLTSANRDLNIHLAITSTSIGILHKTKYLLNQKSLLLLYSSIIPTYMRRHLEIWENSYKTNTKPV